MWGCLCVCVGGVSVYVFVYERVGGCVGVKTCNFCTCNFVTLNLRPLTGAAPLFENC